MQKNNKTEEGTFWYLNDKKYIIDKAKLFQFLTRQGIYLTKIEKSWFIIQEEDNIVRNIDKTSISQIVLDHIRKLDEDDFEKRRIENALRSAIGSILADNQLNLLTRKELKLVKDNIDECFLFYNLRWVKITSQSINEFDYVDLQGQIWESKMIDRDAELIDSQLIDLKDESEFGKFLWNVSSQEEKRFFGICSMIGYLLHEFQNPRINKSIVLMDEKISDNPNGGTGKGIIKTALEEMKEVVIKDGKNFNWTRFPFQDVQHSTSIIAFEDVHKNFDSERLFSCQTDGLKVEKKGKNQYKIGKEDVPKFLIITNYVLKGNGNSFERRRTEFELSQHYNANNTPFDEFEHNLFSEWDQDEYNLFDNFMMRCIQLFLKEGIIETEKFNIEMKRIEAETCTEFVEFISTKKLNVFHDRTELRLQFEREYQEVLDDQVYKPRSFVKWIREYADYKKYEYLEERKNLPNNQKAQLFKYSNEIELTQEGQKKVDELKESIAKSKCNKAVKGNSEPIDVKKKLKEIQDKVDK